MNCVKKTKKGLWYGVLLSALLFVGCSEKDAPPVEKGKVIFASNYPLAYFAEKISGTPDCVFFPEMEGDPVFWEPSVEDITSMQKADVILINGATYEKWWDKVSLSKGKTCDTSASFQDQYIFIEDVSTHSHGPEGAHSHAGTAFTTWLDFTQAVRQAQAVRDALVDAEIGPKETLMSNFNQLKEQLTALDESLSTMTEGSADVPLFASHPVYQYFSRRYDLNINAVMWEPDALPDEGMWAALEELQESRAAAWMIWEDTPLPESVERLEGMGIRSVVFSPCGNRPDQGDFETVMKRNLENLKRVFQ